MRGKVKDSDWKEIDPWWSPYAKEEQKELLDLYDLMEKVSKKWSESDSRFDVDPLEEDWSENSNKNGPLNTSLEKFWSDWLAHLLRSSPKYFIQELFSVDFDGNSTSVTREKSFQDKENSDRRADILLFCRDKGISIEVKIDDLNYSKTNHTASLIEERDNRDWKHFLLLPKYNENILKNVFGSRFKWLKGSNPKIHSKKYSDVEVIYWKDVSFNLRKTMLKENNLHPHWEASAYLLITLIEEKLFGIYPQCFIERNIIEDSDASFLDINRLNTIDVKEQIEYFSNLIEVENYG